MWGIATKKKGRVAVKEQGKSGPLLFNRSLKLIRNIGFFLKFCCPLIQKRTLFEPSTYFTDYQCGPDSSLHFWLHFDHPLLRR
jgi:hypothetical protein